MANHLQFETSAYLKQHAEQPVDWYAWGPEALERARLEDKPIFLSIGYSSCHWCHVMAHESFADEEVAALLRQYFIAVKVDREERPDLDQLYMLACQFLTGSGGWPLSVFITPEGLPFFAGTYFPKRGGYALNVPGFIEIINYLGPCWSTHREELLRNGREIAGILHSLEQSRPPDEVLSVDLLAAGAFQLAENFDCENGGFGAAPKFPTPHQLLFLLRWYRRSGTEAALEMVEKTLAKMADGGIFDHLGGGFHRYAVDRQWRIPHFEKMLYDQAGLLLVYAEAYRISANPLHSEVAAAIVAYLERELQGEHGAFCAAQDADSEGREGAFYVWNKAQIAEILGPADGELFCRAYGVSEGGNFPESKGASVLYRVREELPAAAFPALTEKVLRGWRERLFAARSQRPEPFIDGKILTSWNGLAIAALARAAVVFQKPSYCRLAVTAAAALEKNLWRPENRLWRRWVPEGTAGIPAFLDDYAFLIAGLLELDAAGAGPAFRRQARALTNTVNELFWDDEGERFFYSGSDAEKLIARNLELHDGVLPGANAVMIMNLLRLYALTGETVLQGQAEMALGRMAGLVAQNPLLYLHTLSALDEYLP
ncbi:MAG: thioredoxin domain-containing protein [Deltaproteobacteria bacterium]|nr:thioredoxin domain-containing protein [Deltaproteobacteria bacterium]